MHFVKFCLQGCQEVMQVGLYLVFKIYWLSKSVFKLLLRYIASPSCVKMSEKGVYFYFVDARVEVVKHFIELGDLHFVASVAVIQVENLFRTDAISSFQGIPHP